MSFINYSKAIQEWLIPEGIVWSIDTEVYSSEWKSTGACNEVSKLNNWDQSIVLVEQLAEWFQIKCGHILEGGVCGYLTHNNNEKIICPFAENYSLIPQNTN